MQRQLARLKSNRFPRATNYSTQHHTEIISFSFFVSFFACVLAFSEPQPMRVSKQLSQPEQHAMPSVLLFSEEHALQACLLSLRHSLQCLLLSFPFSRFL